MRTIKRTSLPLLLILLGVFACAMPVVPQVDQNAAGTAVAETLSVIIQMTRDAGSGVSLDASDTPTIPFTDTTTPEPPTATSTLTFTPLPTLTHTPPPTFAPLLAMISVSVPTNCREGPGKTYDMVGALTVGEVVQVYGRTPGSDYWYIRNPDSPSHFCWVWGEYATVSGLTSAVPVFTPPPTPTPTYTATPHPDFDASYGGLEACSGWWVDIDLHNTGTITFRSVSLTVKDTVTSTVVSAIGDGFTDRTGCSSSTTKKTLAPGKTLGQSSPKFAYDPGGHKLKVTVTLCSGTGLNGTCITDQINFTP